MRPLMVPDPQCASCHGSFVEKMENPSDDPREFQQPGQPELDADNLPPDIDHFLVGLRGLMNRGPDARPPNSRVGAPSGLRFEVQSSGTGRRTVTIGGPNILGTRLGGNSSSTPPAVPSMSDYRRENNLNANAAGGTPITGPIMAQYLSALLGAHGGPADPLAALFALGLGNHGGLGAASAESGRWGDYAFNQEALDQIITQLMENSNTTRPVPATEEIMSNLPREVLEAGAPMLEKECAVCKESFQLASEDPDEQIVVSLPCLHPFHEGCIMPWLKNSGTCPVCRYALIEQPEHHAPGAAPVGPRTNPSAPSSPRVNASTPSSPRANASSSPTRSSTSPRAASPRTTSPRTMSPGRGTRNESGGPSLLNSLLGYMGSGSGSSSGSTSGSSRHTRTNSAPPTSRRSTGGDNPSPPGGWGDHDD